MGLATEIRFRLMPDVYIFDEVYNPTDVVLRLSAASGAPGATNYVRNLSEVLSTSEMLSRTLVSSRLALETFSTSDSVIRSLAISRTNFETLSTLAQLSRVIELSRTSEELLTTTDIVTRLAEVTRTMLQALVTDSSVQRVVAGEEATGKKGTRAYSIFGAIYNGTHVLRNSKQTLRL